MHMKFHQGLEKLFPSDCLNINEFGATHINIH